MVYRAALRLAAEESSEESIQEVAEDVANSRHYELASYLGSKGWKITYSHDEFRVLSSKDPLIPVVCSTLRIGDEVDALIDGYWVKVEVSDFGSVDTVIVDHVENDYAPHEVRMLDLALLNTHTSVF